MDRIADKDQRTKKIGKIAVLNRILKQIDHFLNEDASLVDGLKRLPGLFIPGFADWCCIHLRLPDSSFERIAFDPTEMLNTQAVYDWVQNDFPNDEIDGLPGLLPDGQPKWIEQVNSVRRAALAGIQSYLLVPLVAHQQLLGAVTLILANPGRQYDPRILDIAENLALHLTACLEKTQLHRESQQLKADLEERVGKGTIELEEALAQLKQTEETAQSLFAISNKLNATQDVDQILDTLAREAIQMVHGESGFAGLRTPEGMSVNKFFQDGEEVPFEHVWALGEGIPGWVLKFKVPYGTSDAENDPLIRRDLAINANIHSIICTPILDTTGEVLAFFDIRNKKGEEGFTITDQEMLLMLAPVASITIQNALAYQQRLATVNELSKTSKHLQELAMGLDTAREEERIQISRELHDQLGQALTAIKFDLASLSDQLSQKDDTLAQKSRDITSQVNSLIKEVRRIATELRPGMLDDLGLAASMEWQVQDFEKRTGIACSLHLPNEELSLTQDQSLALFRIFQEALTNIGRYANAHHVEVSLAKAGEFLRLEMHDDGQGIKEEDISGSHSLGLIGMRERVKFLGGTLEIKGVPAQGTTLSVIVPVGKATASSKGEI